MLSWHDVYVHDKLYNKIFMIALVNLTV
jgi:hypothetical protein